MKKGSITVFLALTLCVITSLIFVAIDSARYSCGRAYVSLSADEGLMSLFGEYDRIIYENYGLLMVDAGYGTGSLKMGALAEEVTDVMEKVLSPGTVFSSSSNLFRADIDSKSITAYTLATDSGSAMLKEQIREIMELRLGEDVINAMYASFSDSSSLAETAEKSNSSNLEEVKAQYEAEKAKAEEAAAAAAAASQDASGTENTGDAAEEGEETQASLPDDFENPVDQIYTIYRLGLMGVCLPDVSAVSPASLGDIKMASDRENAAGIGEMPEDESKITDSFTFARYILDYFPNFLSDGSTSGLKYQAEYAIAGKTTDVDNLKTVLNRIALIREGINLAYLYTDPQKKAEIESVVMIVCSFFLLPELTEAVTALVLAGWAYAESLMDIKILLAGGKVPILKDDSTWKLSLSNLSALFSDASQYSSGSGLSYEDYLCILLMLKGSDSLMTGIMDLIEYNRRVIGNEPSFSIKTCLCSLELQVEGCIADHQYTLKRSYGYDIYS